MSVCIDSEVRLYDLSGDWLFSAGLCGGLTAGLLSLDTLRSDEASSVLFITLELSGRPDVLITRLSGCWNIWAYMRPLSHLHSYSWPSNLHKNKCITVQRRFLKFSSIVATRYLLFPQSRRSWLALLGFNNWWRALDQQFSSRNYAIVPPNIIYALDDFLAPVKGLLHIVRRD